jgi:hypothetical protein
MVNRLFLIVVLIFGNYVYAQQSDCKVTIADISGSYSGGCKNGLAHGKGVAQGTDRYEGQFIKGMPDGKGIYKWANGTYFEGQWKNGMKEGFGKMVYRDSVVTGYWKGDKYQGKKLIPPFKITNSRSVSRSTITKSVDVANGVRIRILQGGSDNTTIEDFSLSYDSGNEYRMTNIYGIQNTSLPLDVKITYRTWNQLHTAQYEVLFEFTIYDPGTWEVVISN